LDSEKDVLGKADALLRRHSSSPVGTETGSVPVLTDIIDPHAGEDAPGDLAQDDLAQQVLRRVMAQVEERLAAELERRLALHLVPQVHAAVASALGDLRQELADAIGDAVAQALKDRPPG
jgi:hypothetical protein